MNFIKGFKIRRAKRLCLKDPQVRLYSFELTHIDLSGRRDEVHYFRGTARQLEDEARRYLYTGWFDNVHTDIFWNKGEKVLRMESRRVWRSDGSYSSVTTRIVNDAGDHKIEDLPWMG